MNLVGPKSNDKGLGSRRGEDTPSWKQAQGGFSLIASGRSELCQHCDFGLVASRAARKSISVV